MKDFTLKEFINNKEGVSVSKVAIFLSMVDDLNDNSLVEFFKSSGIKCVITRAGGRGDNLKDKLFRNSLTAAEHSGVITTEEKYKYVFLNIFEKIFKKINSGIYGISGAGFKIGIARNNTHIAVAISGKIGVPGINIDFEVVEVETGFIGGN
ncbi:MAG: HutP family protein [Candidatus Muiribacteriota bacterium]|jgi:hypothetical protein